MKKTLYVLLLLIGTLSAKGQDSTLSFPRVSDQEDTVWLSDAVRFIVGHDVRVGSGSTDDGSFKYIRISSASWTHFSSSDGANSRAANEAISLPVTFSGLKMHIKKLRVVGNKKRGYVIYLVLGGGTLTNYECDIVQAVKYGEIDCKNCESMRKSKINTTTIINNGQSTADELAKLKKLKDDGVLTEDEFQIQKAKLLSK